MKRDAKENLAPSIPQNSNLVAEFKPPKLVHLIGTGTGVINVKEELMLLKNFLSESKN